MCAADFGEAAAEAVFLFAIKGLADVRYWHKADMGYCTHMFAFGVTADKYERRGISPAAYRRCHRSRPRCGKPQVPGLIQMD